MISQALTFIVAFAFGFAPDLVGYNGTTEALIAHLIGPLAAFLTTVSCFPSMSFARNINNWIGLALALSPLIDVHALPSALVVQAVAGLWIMAFSMMAKPLHETGGWRRALKHVDEVDLDWA